MSEVWLALHRTSPEHEPLPVALKVMTAEQARRAAFVSTFRNEVRAVAALDHPGIVTLLDHGELDLRAEQSSGRRFPAGSPYLAMELASRGSLQRSSGMPWIELRAILLSLLDALAYAHARGVLHRDLKPSNVLLAGPGDVRPGLKITDFGLACSIEPEEERAPGSRGAGSPNYMAPEQLLGRWRDYGPWTDLFALGCIAYQLASGSRPWITGDRAAVLEARMSSLPQPLIPDVELPPGFAPWLAKLLERNPARRFQCAANASQALIALDDSMSRPISAGWRAKISNEPLPRWMGAELSLYPLRRVPLIDREAERDRAWTALRMVERRAEARVLIFRGAAGNGKSRLAEWLAERSHELGAATTMRAVHGPTPGPSDGLAPMLARWFRTSGLKGADIAARVETSLRALGVDDEGEWLGLSAVIAPARSSVPPSSLELELPARHALIARHLARLGGQRPLIVWIDDVQWASDALDLIAHVMSRSEPARVLFVLTAREEALAERSIEAAQLSRLLQQFAPRVDDVLVAPLSPDQQLELLQSLLSLEQPLALQAAERTAGNPLFAVQLVSDWVQRGVLLPSLEGLRLAPGEAAALPDNLHAVWKDRIERLVGDNDSWRVALELAALLGRAVDLEEWRLLNGGDQEALINALFATRLAVPQEGGFSFAHGMLRESLERSAIEAGRAPSHHRSIAAMLLTRKASGAAFVERIGRHLDLAGDHAEAIAALYEAALARLARGEVHLAAGIARQIELILSRGVEISPELRGDLWLLVAHVARLSSRFSDAEAAALRAEELGHKARAMFERALIAQRLGRFASAVSLHEAALEAFVSDELGAARCLRELAFVHQQRGELDRASACATGALLRFRAAGDRLGVARTMQRAGLIERQRGDHAGAARKYRGAMALFRRVSNQLGVADCLNGLGDTARFSGRFDDAEKRYLASVEIAARMGSGTYVVPKLNLGLIALARRDFDRAQSSLESLAIEVERTGQRALLGCVLIALLPCYASSGDHARFDDARRRGRALMVASGMIDVDLAWPAELAGDICVAARDLRRARAAYLIAYRQWRGLPDAASVSRLVVKTRGN